tara:strand:- start:607 stop:771 length:165 start_codon:yes stop_codon:yes gene_type:complete
MIIEVSFGLAGGINFALEKSWNIVKDIMIKYPQATWKKITDFKKGSGKYIVEID